jgi:hypothetical protein
VQSLNCDSAVPMLWVGASNNFDLLKRQISVACMEKYENLSKLIINEKYYEPIAIDTEMFNLTNDPYEIEKGRLREAHKQQYKEVDDMQKDRTSMYAYIISKLSKESLDEIQGHVDWPSI